MKRSLITMFAPFLVSAGIATAQIFPNPKSIVVLQPTDLPQEAQIVGQSMQLYPLTNGKTYLYIEQEQMGRLVVLDVTHPAHIVTVGTVQTSEAFDFGTQISPTAFVLRFRDEGGSGVLDLRSPKHPVLAHAVNLPISNETQRIGRFGVLVGVGTPTLLAPELKDYRVVDSSRPVHLRLIASIHNVQKVVDKDDTGTTFLLGAEGLTVVRRPSIEQQQELDSKYANN
jgi:hypothetical protein